MKKSLVVVMPVGRYHQHHNLGVVNLVHQSMLVANLVSPLACSVSGELLWLASACTGMLVKLTDKFQSLRVKLWLVLLQFCKVKLGFLLDFNKIAAYRLLIYRSSSSTLSNLFDGPFLASSIIWKNSSFVMSVGSASFSATSLRKYLATRFSMLSSSAIAPRLRSISAFNCTAVMSNTY